MNVHAVRSLTVAVLFLVSGLNAEPWSFAHVSDNRASTERPAGTYEAVLKEIRDMNLNPAPAFPKPEFVVGAGDVCLSVNSGFNWNLWKTTFASASPAPFYVPNIGNHDAGDAAFSKANIFPTFKQYIPNYAAGVNPDLYAVDYKNVRIVVHTSVNNLAEITKLVTSAPATVQHIFMLCHYPVFPRHDHVETPALAETNYWKMLLANKSKVRAMLVGHTHWYSRLRVANPTGADALNALKFPNEAGGIYQIDAGNAGRGSHSDGQTSIVWISVDGGNLSFRVTGARHTTPTKFFKIDEWTLTQGSTSVEPVEQTPYQLDLEMASFNNTAAAKASFPTVQKRIELKLFATNGKLVSQAEGANTRDLNISMQRVRSGYYYLRIRGDNGEYTRQIRRTR